LLLYIFNIKKIYYVKKFVIKIFYKKNNLNI
jgi:hypothetical protein